MYYFGGKSLFKLVIWAYDGVHDIIIEKDGYLNLDNYVALKKDDFCRYTLYSWLDEWLKKLDTTVNNQYGHTIKKLNKQIKFNVKK